MAQFRPGVYATPGTNRAAILFLRVRHHTERFLRSAPLPGGSGDRKLQVVRVTAKLVSPDPLGIFWCLGRRFGREVCEQPTTPRRYWPPNLRSDAMGDPLYKAEIKGI